MMIPGFVTTIVIEVSYVWQKKISFGPKCHGCVFFCSECVYHGRYRHLLVVMLTMKVCRSKYYLSLFQNRALAPLQIPASLCEGPIYVLLCWVIILLLKSTSWRAPLSFACIAINLHWVWLWLDLFYHELQCLVSPWSLKVLCIYVLRSQKGLARYHLVISYFEKVLSSEIYYYCSLVDYAIDMSKHET